MPVALIAAGGDLSATGPGGPAIHTLLEWSGCSVALFTAVLGAIVYKLRQDATMAVIVAALACACAVDAAHILLADGLIAVDASTRAAQVLTWTASRTLCAAILLGGSAISLSGRVQQAVARVGAARVMATTIVALAGVTTTMIVASASRAVTLQAITRNGFITRPYDAVPLVMFAVAGLVVFPAALRRNHSFFSTMLIVSAIPHVATQLHMMFGSVAPLDSHAVAAHALKVVAYATPLAGLLLDYVHAYDREATARARSQTFMATSVDGIITIDEHGIIESFNHAAEEIFQYPAAYAIGRNVSILAPPPDRERHDGYLARYLRTGQRRKIGTVSEVEAMRFDGTRFPLELAVSETRVAGRTSFTAMVRDVTERHAMDRIKREFISTVSHELRTPLTSIRGSLGLIAAGAAGSLPPEAQQLITVASSNTDRLVRLVNDILDLEQIESGQLALRLETAQLPEVIRAAVTANVAFGRQFHVQFDVAEPLPPARVRIDIDRIGQVFDNLLSNAAKFSPRGGVVTITLAVEPSVAKVSITDRGQGIPHAFRTRLFDKFTQADASDTRARAGSGLGLSICKRLVEQHGGAIEFDSKIGEGTTFTFSLPLARGDIT